jgi:UDPglucose 6-dehydrogenase
MKISVIGTGYVGLVHGTVLSVFGNEVTCIDIDENKINRLNNLDIPIYEDGLEHFVKESVNKGDLKFSTNYNSIKDSDIVFIAVGTPSNNDGSANLNYVFNAVDDICNNLGEKDTIIVTKSTVPVGTTYKIKEIVNSKKLSCKVGFASNPEFLKEGCALEDSFMPERIVIGYEEDWVKDKLDLLYKKISCIKLFTNIQSSEMIKYASNSMLATRIAFMNEIANLCQAVGANIDDVKAGVGSDSRIGNKFLNPGCGYGGSCFPKDVKELIVTGDKNGVDMSIIKTVDASNDRQKELPVKYLKEMVSDLYLLKVCVLGASFKPGTDDIREASSITIVRKLLEYGCHVHIYDPIAIKNIKKIFGDVVYCFSDPYIAINECDAAIVVTEWDEIVNLNWIKVRDLMWGNVLIDGRNCLDKNKMKCIGFNYRGI